MDCSLPGSPAHGILQASVLEWGAIAFSGVYRQRLHFLCSLAPILARSVTIVNVEMNMTLGKQSFLLTTYSPPHRQAEAWAQSASPCGS